MTTLQPRSSSGTGQPQRDVSRRRATLVAGLLVLATAGFGSLAITRLHALAADDLSVLLLTCLELATCLAAAAWSATTAHDVVRLAGLGPALRIDAALPRRRARVAALLLGTSLGSAALPAAVATPRPAAVMSATVDGRHAPAYASRAPAGDATPVSPDLPTETVHGAGPVSPDLPVAPAPRPASPRPLRVAPADDEVVVHRGQTLWQIAAAHLPEGATDAEVARSCRAWHELNRAVIGRDPDLILPGQVLRVPARQAAAP